MKLEESSNQRNSRLTTNKYGIRPPVTGKTDGALKSRGAIWGSVRIGPFYDLLFAIAIAIVVAVEQ